MRKLSRREEEMLDNYERKFGKEKADKWREQFLNQPEEEQVEETNQSPQEMQFQGDLYFKCPEDVEPKSFKFFFNKMVKLLEEARKLKNYHGLQVLLIQTPRGAVFVLDGEVVVNEDDERILENEIDDLPPEDKLEEEKE